MKRFELELWFVLEDIDGLGWSCTRPFGCVLLRRLHKNGSFFRRTGFSGSFWCSIHRQSRTRLFCPLFCWGSLPNCTVLRHTIEWLRSVAGRANLGSMKSFSRRNPFQSKQSTIYSTTSSKLPSRWHLEGWRFWRWLDRAGRRNVCSNLKIPFRSRSYVKNELIWSWMESHISNGTVRSLSNGQRREFYPCQIGRTTTIGKPAPLKWRQHPDKETKPLFGANDLRRTINSDPFCEKSGKIPGRAAVNHFPLSTLPRYWNKSNSLPFAFPFLWCQ